MKRDAQLSSMRNNKTVLPDQQQNRVLGTDGEKYSVSSSDQPKKRLRHRQKSKKVANNNTLSELGMGNYNPEMNERLNRLRDTSIDFSNFLVQSAIWWLAQGWYVAIRKSYIAMGPPSQNDKYFVNLANPFTTHRDAVFALNLLLEIAYNNVRTKGQQLDVKIPKHLSFAIAVLATKQLQRTPTGVVDMATQPDIGTTIQFVTSNYATALAYINEVVALPAHPFPVTGNVEVESPITVYHDSNGEAIHSTMKLEEIASVYGYFVPNGGLSYLPKDVFNYDYNGFDHPSSTQLFRSAFFKAETTSFIPQLELNPQLMPNQFVDPRLVLLNFAATGFIPTSEHTMYCVAEHMSTSVDRTDKFTSSQGLTYIHTKSSVGFPVPTNLVTPDPLAYNCALDLAMALQTQVSNFCQITATAHTDPKFPFDETNYSWAVAVAQYIEKIPLPSVLFEEMKNFSDVNSWTIRGKPEPTAIYYRYNSIYERVLGQGAKPTAGTMTLDNYFTNVATSSAFLMEVRFLCKLNMAPEINNFMPSVHLILRDSQDRLYSILDVESFRHKDISMWINFSYIPVISESRPLPLTYLEVKRVDTDNQLKQMYQMCIDATLNGKASELDAYYARLRDKQIGFFGALSSILGAVLPMVPSLVSTIFKPHKKKQEAPSETTKSTFSSGALVQSVLNSLVNQKDFKQVAVNAPAQTKSVVKHPESKQRILADKPALRKLVRQRLLKKLGKA